MRLRYVLLTITLMSLGSVSAAAAEKPPYLYYYSSALRAFVVERADGTDSRTLGQSFITPDARDINLIGWSPSGDWLAWVEDRTVLKIISVDGVVQRTLTDNLHSAWAAWSPTDDLLFITQGPDQHDREIKTPYTFTLVDAAHNQTITQFERMVKESNGFTDSAWSLDGQFIGFYFQNYNEDPAVRKFESTFVLVSRDGKVTEQSLSPTTSRSDVGIGVVHWTPQGWLAHYLPGGDKMLVMNPANQDQFEVGAPRSDPSNSNQRIFLWSPAGDYALYYVSLPRSGDAETPYEVWLLSITDRRLTRIVEQAYLKFAYYFDPLQLALFNFTDADINAGWSPDGKRAVFRTSADVGFAVLDPLIGAIYDLPLELPSDRFGRYYFDIRWTPDSQSLEFDNDTADTPVQTFNLETKQASENDAFSVVRSAYSPSGRYVATSGMAGNVFDLAANVSYTLPVHSASVYNKTQYQWDSSEAWLITQDYLCVAGDCPAILRYGVTNPQDSYWRELGDAEVDWLPSQVNPSKLPTGAAESVLLAPETIDRDVEFSYGSENQTLQAICDPADATALLIQDRATDTILYRLHNTQLCYGGGSSAYSGVSPDGHLLALASNGSLATLWDAESGKLLARFNCTCFEMRFSDDSTQLFTRASSAMLTWDVAQLLERAAVK